MKFKMILAADSKGGIGKGGTLPWEGLYIKFSLTDVPWSDYRTSLDGRTLRPIGMNKRPYDSGCRRI